MSFKIDIPLKILWISNFAPVSVSADAGSKTFNYYYNQFCSDERFNVRLISCAFYKHKEAIKKELSGKDCKIIYWNNPRESKLSKIGNIESKYNIFNRYCNLLSNTTVHIISRTVNEYKKQGYTPDVVILEWTNMVLLAKMIRKIFPNTKIVASEHDVTFIGYERKSLYYKGLKRAGWKLRYKRERKKELDALKICDLILPQNPDNIEVLKKEGIQENKMQWLIPFFQDLSVCERNAQIGDILFFGAMSRPENYLSAIWFIEKVMPLLNDIPVRFIILGSNPSNEIKKYQSNNVIITGFVDSVKPFFEKSMCLVAPLVLGAGIKVKIIEALSSGIPVVTNGIGIEGIPAQSGKEYFFCEQPEEYAMTIRKMFNGMLNYDLIGKAGKRFVLEKYSLEKSTKVYKERLISFR